MKKLVSSWLLLFLFASSFSVAETIDSLKLKKRNPTTLFFKENNFENSDSANTISNSLKNFQNYIPHTHLGNIGLPINDVLINYFSPQLGFNYFKNNNRNYFYTPTTLLFFNTRTPYSDLFYVLGSKKEQNFKMTFSYNVKKNWNVTANFTRLRSEGFYFRQKTDNTFWALSTNYKSNNNRYWLLGAIIYNTAKNAENGGLSNDSIFEVGGLIANNSYNLLEAKREIKNRNIFVKQYFNFGRKLSDSTKTIIPASQLILTSISDDNILKYIDANPTTGYYANIFNDSLKTLDSTYNFKIENELLWKRIDNGKHRGFKDKFGMLFSAKHELINIYQLKSDTLFNNLIVGAGIYNTYSDNKFWVNLNWNYVVSGFNKNDYNIVLKAKKTLKDTLSCVFFNASTHLQTPDFIYHRYNSNHFRWNNILKQTKEDKISIAYSKQKYDLHIGVSFSNYSNIVYFDNYATPKQYNGSIALASVFLKKNFTIHNWHLDNKINYQYIPDSVVIRLPQFVLEHTLYYENDVFKGAMVLQIGASVFYTSAYYSNAYMPATNQFYLQSDKKYANYPFIDFFVNARIQRVRIFFKIDHLNSGFMGYTYMQTPHYAMNSRAFKLGLSWRFYD